MKKLLRILIFFISAFSNTLLFAQEDVMQIFARAEHLRKSNNFIAAIDEYDRAIALEPENPRFPFSKGMCYLTLKEYDNAILAYEETAKLKQDFVPAYTMMAKCYQNLDRHIKVEETLDKAFQYETDLKKRIAYKEAVIKILFEAENYDRALRHVNDVKMLDAENPSILYYEAVIQNSKGNYEAAKQAMLTATSKVTSKEPKVVARFYYELGYAYNKLGDYEKSREAFKYANFGPYAAKIAKLSPQYYMSAAIAHMQIKDYDKSKELLKIALQMQNDYSEAYVMLGKIAKIESDQTKAIEKYNKAISIEEDEKSLLKIKFDLAELYLDNGKYDDAIKIIDEYLALDTKNYNALFIKAVAHMKLKSFNEAINDFQKLTDFQGLDVEHKTKFEFALAILYKEIKNYDLAKQSLKRAAYGNFKSVSMMAMEEITEEEKSKEEQ
ncbi:tetratricopeptide repeat protein [Chondrinema litorale]|uniref:tetratricopeptide repeat protein n=1 Tax=Chondrinema litorale TaxID=2994555 RepID=UPI002543861E|nr:tetratricopeptide repeat protein [Chondrinema litorale]UZR95985.1 tetratricopeptide repeat protein [Chondrinema litorale]